MNLWHPGQAKMIVTAILLFSQIVGIRPHIWVSFLHSYHLFLLGYIQLCLGYVSLNLSVIHSRNYELMASWTRKHDSNCNTTIQSDRRHPTTHLGTHPTLISPLPTWLHCKRPRIYAELWVESTQKNYEFTVSWAWKDDSNCNTTVQMDGGHLVTHLCTLTTLLSPYPTWLHPKNPCLYA